MTRDQFLKSMVRRLFMKIRVERSGRTVPEAEERYIAFALFWYIMKTTRPGGHTRWWIQSARYLKYTAKSKTAVIKVGVQGNRQTVEIRARLIKMNHTNYRFMILGAKDMIKKTYMCVRQTTRTGRVILEPAKVMPSNMG